MLLLTYTPVDWVECREKMGVKWEEKDLWAGVKDTQKPGRGVLACKCGLPVRVTCFFSRAASIFTTGEGKVVQPQFV